MSGQRMLEANKDLIRHLFEHVIPAGEAGGHARSGGSRLPRPRSSARAAAWGGRAPSTSSPRCTARIPTCASPSTTSSPKGTASRSAGRFAGPTPGRCSAGRPSGQPVELAAIVIFRIANGKITERWAGWKRPPGVSSPGPPSGSVTRNVVPGAGRALERRRCPRAPATIAATIGQPEARAAVVARARGVAAVEALEDVRGAARRSRPGPAIRDLEHRARRRRGARGRSRRHRPACARARSRAGCPRPGAGARASPATVDGAPADSSVSGRVGLHRVRRVDRVAGERREVDGCATRAAGPGRAGQAAAGRRRAGPCAASRAGCPVIERSRSAGRSRAPRSNSSAYALTAAIGVRSSCEASEMKRRRRASEAERSANASSICPSMALSAPPRRPISSCRRRAPRGGRGRPRRSRQPSPRCGAAAAGSP